MTQAAAPLPTLTIADARDAALVLLRGALRSKRAVDEKFDAVTAALERRDRAFVRLLVATTLRRLGQIDDVLSRFLKREPAALVRDALRLGTAQALFLDTAPHAAVATTVELVKRHGEEWLAGLANAVMRKVATEGKAIVAAQDAARLNTPDWLRERWVAAFGEKAAAEISAAHLIEPPLDLSLKTADDTLIKLLGGDVLPAGTVRLTEAGRIESVPGFGDGDWWVQDAAAALPAKILLGALGVTSGGGAGKTIADLCAAPGGKTLQLAASGARVFAVDNAAKRLALVGENLTRTKLKAEVITADARVWQPPEQLDAVLLDAPCSATGTIRRHPDLPYLKTATELDRFPAVQAGLLKAALAMLKPGGVLVYCVCALDPGEGEGVVDAVLAETPNVSRAPIDPAWIGGCAEFITPRGDLRTLPCQWPERGGLDGFYAALLRVD